MKNIQEIQIWKNGSLRTATTLMARITSDDLNTSCTFIWYLKATDQFTEGATEPGEVLAEGEFIISGDEYANWDGSNDAAYAMVADNINVIIV